jgi:hypothetical protein
MNKISFVIAAILITGILACKNNNKHSSDPLLAKADSLYDQVIKEHNRGMSGWNKIEGRKKRIINKLDSMAALPSNIQASLDAYKTNLNEVAGELGNAYEKMDVWMREMKLDSAENNTEIRVQYLTGENLKGGKITELINNSLQKADSLLKIKL